MLSSKKINKTKFNGNTFVYTYGESRYSSPCILLGLGHVRDTIHAPSQNNFATEAVGSIVIYTRCSNLVCEKRVPIDCSWYFVWIPLHDSSNFTSRNFESAFGPEKAYLDRVRDRSTILKNFIFRTKKFTKTKELTTACLKCANGGNNDKQVLLHTV